MKNVGGHPWPKLTIYSLLFLWCWVSCISALGCHGQYIKLYSCRSGSPALSKPISPRPPPSSMLGVTEEAAITRPSVFFSSLGRQKSTLKLGGRGQGLSNEFGSVAHKPPSSGSTRHKPMSCNAGSSVDADAWGQKQIYS